MAKINSIIAEMIAPCGLNCAVCKNALQEKNPCRGCRGAYECKPNYCANICKIPHCNKLKDGFCTCPPEYLCEQLEEKRNRYGSAYQIIERPIDNLLYIRDKGIEAFIEKERDYWKCPVCGELMCVQLGKCSECGYEATRGDQENVLLY